MNSISTHVLDTNLGIPAAGVPVSLEIQTKDGSWKSISQGLTDADGRISQLVPTHGFIEPGIEPRIEPGIYRITFDTSHYFRSIEVQALYPSISVVFEKRLEDSRHFHIPLLLSPNGYSTYRGS